MTQPKKVSARTEKRLRDLENDYVDVNIKNGKLSRKVEELDGILLLATNRIYSLQEEVSEMQGKVRVLEARSLKSKDPVSWLDRMIKKMKK